MLKLKLKYLGHLMGRANSLEKTLMLGKIKGRRRRGRQRMRWSDGVTDLMDMSLSKLRWWTGKPGVLQSEWATEQQHYKEEMSPSCLTLTCCAKPFFVLLPFTPATAEEVRRIGKNILIPQTRYFPQSSWVTEGRHQPPDYKAASHSQFSRQTQVCRGTL